MVVVSALDAAEGAVSVPGTGGGAASVLDGGDGRVSVPNNGGEGVSVPDRPRDSLSTADASGGGAVSVPDAGGWGAVSTPDAGGDSVSKLQPSSTPAPCVRVGGPKRSKIVKNVKSRIRKVRCGIYFILT